ncbi:hypothetical protein CHS0354_023784 [Potamilus streckersoni]|uniref:Uncharacterized protein n=1 Tax=Potamilus streckersoni TaxID=2493646 RepID=A0AAE0RZ89_9BIVA|nr:hypothetical protein CHS0354_023784 [Potamilus streckersoni]
MHAGNATDQTSVFGLFFVVIPSGIGAIPSGIGVITDVIGAMSIDNEAMGSPNVVMGSPNEVMGSPNEAMGSPNVVMGSPNVAMGSPNVAMGSPNVVMGSPNVVMGSPNVVMGSPNVVMGSPNVVMGSPNVIMGSPNVVMGSCRNKACLVCTMGSCRDVLVKRTVVILFGTLSCELPIAETRTPPIQGNFQNFLKFTEVPIVGRAYNYTKSPNSRFVSPQNDDPYAYAPKSLISMQPSGNYSIAWYDEEARKIKITSFLAADKIIGTDMTVPPNETCDYLAGFDINSKGEYIVAYMLLPTSDHGGILKICKVRSDNSVIYLREVFLGDKSNILLTQEKPVLRYNPLHSGTSRLAVGNILGQERVAFLFSYTHRTQDGDVIKDSLVILNNDGDQETLPLLFNTNSGALDFRLYKDGISLYAFIASVSSPVGVTFQKISGNVLDSRFVVHPLVPNSNPSNISFQLGDIIKTSGNAFYFIAGTSLRYDVSNDIILEAKNPRRDAVFYAFNGSNGKITNKQELTFLDTGNIANPKIAQYGPSSESVIAIWNFISTRGTTKAQIFRINSSSSQPTIFLSSTIPNEIILEPASQLVTDPLTGDVIFHVTQERIATIVCINSLNSLLSLAINSNAKSLLGADLLIRERDGFSKSLELFADSLNIYANVKTTKQIRFNSMGYFNRQSSTAFIQVCASTADFPLYGIVESEPYNVYSLLNNKTDTLTAIVDETLLIQKSLSIGDTISIGSGSFIIRGYIKKISGDNALNMLTAPRVFIPLNSTGRTKLLEYGSLVNYCTYFKFDDESKASQFIKIS